MTLGIRISSKLGMPDTVEETRACIIVLVGVTADANKVASVRMFFESNFEGGTMVPDMPQRKGMRHCAEWLLNYLNQENVFARFDAVHFLNYISGGFVFRLASQRISSDRIGRVVYTRGPIQELVPRQLVRRYTWPLVWLTQGRMITDLAGTLPGEVPQCRLGRETGLIIETGTSDLARSLGLGPHSVSQKAWEPEAMLQGATDVIRVPESHDDVYTSERVLTAVLNFFRTGQFQPQGAPR